MEPAEPTPPEVPLAPTPSAKIDEIAGTKPKKRLSKKARLIIAISALVIAALGLAAVLIFVVFRDQTPEAVLTDREFLTAHAWEKQSAPTVIWTFRADGTGELTTNKSNYYDMKWELENDEIVIKTDWLYDLTDHFTITLDRDADSFTVKNLSDEIESTFVPLGTAEKEQAELEKSE